MVSPVFVLNMHGGFVYVHNLLGNGSALISYSSAENHEYFNVSAYNFYARFRLEGLCRTPTMIYFNTK